MTYILDWSLAVRAVSWTLVFLFANNIKYYATVVGYKLIILIEDYCK